MRASEGKGKLKSGKRIGNRKRVGGKWWELVQMSAKGRKNRKVLVRCSL